MGISEECIYQEKTSDARYKPVLAALLEDLQPGDQIVVSSFDRLSRSTTELLATVEYLQAKNVDLISVKENVDTSTPQGKLFFTVSAAFAEFERSIIHERQVEGIAAAKSRGIKFGRPSIPEDEQLKIVKVYSENPEMSLREAARRTGHCIHTVHKVLHSHGVDIKPYVPKPPCKDQMQLFPFASKDPRSQQTLDGKSHQLPLF